MTALLFVGACGDDEDPIDPPVENPAFVSAFPADGFVNRSVEVALIGEDTNWTDASTVDFGDNITVDSVMAVGSTGLIANITVGPGAALGARDVSVTDSVGTTTLTGGFTVTEVLTVTITGNASQGSSPQVSITNNDVLNPFDLGVDGEGNPILNFEFSDPSVNVFNLDATPNTFTFLMATDVNAPASVDFTLTNGAIVDTLSFDIAPTTPKALTLDGNDTADNLPGPFESVLYEYTATNLEIVTVNPVVSVPDTNLTLSLVLDDTGAFGSFTQVFQPTEFTIEAGQSIYMILLHFDGVGATATTHSGTLDLTIDAGNIVNEDDANNNVPAGAQIIPALPGAYLQGAFADAADEDWMQVTIAAGDDGDDLNVVTSGSSSADTVIDVFDPADTATPIATSTDFVFFDSLTVPALAAGDYLVRITPSTFAAPDPLDSGYRVIITSTDPIP